MYTMIGDVIYLQVLGQSLVVLNSYIACKDLLEKRSAIYSSRPRFVLLSELWVSPIYSSDRFDCL